MEVGLTAAIGAGLCFGSGEDIEFGEVAFDTGLRSEILFFLDFFSELEGSTGSFPGGLNRRFAESFLLDLRNSRAGTEGGLETDVEEVFPFFELFESSSIATLAFLEERLFDIQSNTEPKRFESF